VGVAPEDILEHFHTALQEIMALRQYYQTEGIPGSCIWANQGMDRAKMNITVAKLGNGAVVTYGLKGLAIQAMFLYPATCSVELVGGWFVSFGTRMSPTDHEITQYLINITAPWGEAAKTYRRPWQIFLTAQQSRAGDHGEIVAQALNEPAEFQALNTNEKNARIPWNAALPRTFTEATRPKEIKALLKFGRDSDWQLRVTVASALDEVNSISVTYAIGWEDCTSETDWFWNRFMQAARADGMNPLPVESRHGSTWLTVLRKENNAIAVVLHETR
jgi:hypothetical protein